MTDIVSTFDNSDAEYIDDAVQAAPTTLEEADTEYHGRLIAQSAAAHRVAGEPLRQRYAQESAARATNERERIAAAGGESIATELRGDVGSAVVEVLRLDDITRQAKALRHRVEGEHAEHVRLLQREARADKLDELLGAGWDAAASKTKVPAILDEYRRWTEHVRPQDQHGFDFLGDALAAIDRQHTQRNRTRVLEALADVDRVLVETAEDSLTAAGSAADTLIAEGLTVDATAEDVVEHGGAEVLAAWRAWRDAVAAWGDLQSVRRWVSVAVAKGFRDKDPERLAYGEGVADVEAGAWRTQFAGVGVPVGVAGPHAALVWWTEQGRPAPTGVGSIETEASK